MCQGGRGPQLHYPARQPDRRALVTQIASDLARDVRRGERSQLVAVTEIEAIDRVDQADAADLVEVVVVRRPVRVAPRERLDQREVQLDQPFPGSIVMALVIGAKQLGRGRLPVAVLLRGDGGASRSDSAPPPGGYATPESQIQADITATAPR